MRYIFFHVIVFLLHYYTTMAVFADADVDAVTNILANATLGKTEDAEPLDSIFSKVGRKSGIAFCIEETSTDSAAFREQKGHASLSGKSFGTFLDQLRRDGYTIMTTNRVILVAGPKIKELRKTPLDTRINGFVFEGSHQDFFIALTKYCQGYSVNHYCPDISS
jgi:uncharacterized protein YpbB